MNKENFLISFFRLYFSQLVEPKMFQKMLLVLKMEPQVNEHRLKMFLYDMTNWRILFQNKVYF